MNAGNDIDMFARVDTYHATKLRKCWAYGWHHKETLIATLQESAIEWGARVRAGHLTKQEAWTALNTTISTKLKYPIAACPSTLPPK